MRTIEDVAQEVEKIKYQAKQMAATIERTAENAIPHMINDLDFSEADVRKMYDILDKHDRLLQNGGNADGLEADLRAGLDIGYQEVKVIINTMYDTGRFVNLCREYATENSCIEFDCQPGLYKKDTQ